MSPLGKCCRLQELNLAGCRRLTDVHDALSGCAAEAPLRRLSLARCRELQDVSILGQCTDLQDLNLEGCRRLTDISPALLSGARNDDLAAPASGTTTEGSPLRRLSVAGCLQLQDISALAECTNLRELDLGRCDQFTPEDLSSALSGCLGSLNRLSLANCRQLTELPEALVKCINLEELNRDVRNFQKASRR